MFGVSRTDGSAMVISPTRVSAVISTEPTRPSGQRFRVGFEHQRRRLHRRGLAVLEADGVGTVADGDQQLVRVLAARRGHHRRWGQDKTAVRRLATGRSGAAVAPAGDARRDAELRRLALALLQQPIDDAEQRLPIQRQVERQRVACQLIGAFDGHQMPGGDAGGRSDAAHRDLGLRCATRLDSEVFAWQACAGRLDDQAAVRLEDDVLRDFDGDPRHAIGIFQRQVVEVERFGLQGDGGARGAGRHRDARHAPRRGAGGAGQMQDRGKRHIDDGRLLASALRAQRRDPFRQPFAADRQRRLALGIDLHLFRQLAAAVAPASSAVRGAGLQRDQRQFRRGAQVIRRVEDHQRDQFGRIIEVDGQRDGVAPRVQIEMGRHGLAAPVRRAIKLSPSVASSAWKAAAARA
jgi:hypothetical protein